MESARDVGALICTLIPIIQVAIIPMLTRDDKAMIEACKFNHRMSRLAPDEGTVRYHLQRLEVIRGQIAHSPHAGMIKLSLRLCGYGFPD